MDRFAKDGVTVFFELSGYATTGVGTAPTPFLDESNDPLAVIEEPASYGTNRQDTPKRPQGGFPPQGGSPQSTGADSGKLSKIATNVLMRIMYIARFARPDLEGGRCAYHYDHQVDSPV